MLPDKMLSDIFLSDKYNVGYKYVDGRRQICLAGRGEKIMDPREMGYMRSRLDTGNMPHLKYPNIDMQRTGQRIQQAISEAGYSVSEIQEYLHLSCPQSIYRWFRGQILPSINHMYALSMLLHVHMEELLVMKCGDLIEWVPMGMRDNWWKRFISYRNLLFRTM